MTQTEIAAHAKRLVDEYLEDGIDFCVVYEDDALGDASEDNWRVIHDEANRLLQALRSSLRPLS